MLVLFAFEAESFDVEDKLKDADVLVESREKDAVICAVTTKDSHNTLEQSNIANVVDCTYQVRNVANVVDCTRFGNFNKLLNTTTYVLRFINSLKSRISFSSSKEENRDECTTADERENALMLWIKAEQIELCNQREAAYGKLHSSLKLFEDDNGITRLKGRFSSLSLDYDIRHPILIAGDRPFTELLVHDCHNDVMHAGVETTVIRLRRRFSIVKGRQCVKSILRKCVICKRYQGRVMNSPESSNLPNFIISSSFTFCNLGLDYAGPLYVRETAKAAAKKVYILLFTCASRRAVHLELVPDMKASAFIRAFERLVSRKGMPKFVVSDNFRTFESTQVKRFLAQQGIQQSYILPASPWRGGFYERLVRSVKFSLKETLGRSLLSYEQLETVLCKSEFAINSRPLTYVSSDILEENLTPFHLLFGRNVSYPSGDIIMDPFVEFPTEDVSKMAKYMQQLLRKHWVSFTPLYLNEFREQHLYRKTTRSLSNLPVAGDVVLICDDIPLPRQRWRLGKIIQLVVGKDGNVRGVQLIVTSESKNNTCCRPLQKIIPLEVKPREVSPPEVNNPVEKVFNTAENTCVSNGRPKRRAAREGQLTRRLKEKYVD